MISFKYKNKYLVYTLPALFISACNSSSNTSSSTSQSAPIITFTAMGLGANESIAPSGVFVVNALIEPNGIQISNQTIESVSISLNGIKYGGESIIFGPPSYCTLSSESGNESCSISVSLGYNLESGSYILQMHDSTSSNILLVGQNIPFNVVAKQTCNPCSLFTLNHNGNYGGISGADNLCQTNSVSANVPIGKYKAFITLGGGESVGNNRYACSQPYCIGQNNIQFDWVLHPNTSYIDESANLQFQTNESSIITDSATQALWPTGTTPRIRTGINKDWTSPSASSAKNCSGWTDSEANSSSIVGFLRISSNTLNISKIHNASYTTSNCGAGVDGPDGLLCVQQF